MHVTDQYRRVGVAAGLQLNICYFFMVHDKPAQFLRLLSAIHNDRDRFIVHVSQAASPQDRRAFAEITARFSRLDVLASRMTAWGHWSLVETHAAAIAHALAHADWDYMINLSGACYPLKSSDQIRSRLHDAAAAFRSREGGDAPPAGGGRGNDGRHWPNYVTVQHIDDCPAHVRERYSRFWFLLGGKLRMIPGLRRTPPEALDHGWKGSNWSVLHRGFCEWLDRDPLVGKANAFLRHCKLPEEAWLPWLMMSSPYRHTRSPNRHHINWTRGNAHPHILRSENFEELTASDAFFARKFDPEIDARILDMLDELVARRQSPETDARGKSGRP